MKENSPRLRRWRPPRIRHYREYPTGGFSKPSLSYYKWHSIVKDVPSEWAANPWKSKNIPDWRGWELNNSLTERKHGTVIFLSLRLIASSTKPDFFSSLLTLNDKNTVHLGDGHVWLQLVESFSYLGLRLSEELLRVQPARGTGYQTNFKAA